MCQSVKTLSPCCLFEFEAIQRDNEREQLLRRRSIKEYLKIKTLSDRREVHLFAYQMSWKQIWNCTWKMFINQKFFGRLHGSTQTTSVDCNIICWLMLSSEFIQRVFRFKIIIKWKLSFTTAPAKNWYDIVTNVICYHSVGMFPCSR